MGIPKFYRWLSERYPLVNQPGGATVVPIIDNFYLDMNGIIHNCTHGNNTDVKLTEEEMIVRIFAYLDKLFHIVKPQKVLFLAIDGVAPRAKMNQQRARRFKSAREAEEAAAAAIRRGEIPPDPETRFDSNCITPGTPFMARLGAHLRFFIRKKIAEDVAWQKPTVVFSGHDVPGEGEHKIMEYIRWAKRAPGYAPNTRHCLYGLDADLIMLSLVTHEPHFCLLREIVSYGAGGRGQPAREVLENPCQEHFVLLQIGLLRDYLDMEFRDVATTLPFQYDFERIVDDFVLFCMLVGNDFLPPLPTVDIAEGSLDSMFLLYRRLLPTLGGYLTYAGDLHRGRLEIFIKALAEQESDVLEARANDTEEFESNKRNGRRGDRPAWASSKNTSSRKAKVKPTEMDEDDAFALEMATLALQSEGHELELLAAVEGEPLEAAEEEDKSAPTGPTMMSREARAMFLAGDKVSGLAAWRNRYYREKLRVEDSARRTVLESYIQGLHWVLEYYYRGVASWDWYYPHHYAPMASDFTDLKAVNVVFTQGKPFLPYEQLLAVQPASSCRLLPEPYRWLMTDPKSPISDFYPTDFDVDLEGKRAEWEGVVLIPFIDEQRLLTAARSVPRRTLSREEMGRNTLGDILAFTYSHDSKEDAFCASTLPAHYTSVARSHSVALTQAAPPPLPAGAKGFVPEFVPGTKIGSSGPPGFPTLRTLSLSSELRRAGINVFGSASRKESLILRVRDPPGEGLSVATVAAAVVGKRAWVKWPYLQEALVVAVSDSRTKAVEGGATRPLTAKEADEWSRTSDTLARDYLFKHGLDVGPLRVMLHVRPCEGLVRQIDGTVEKRFGKTETTYPLQVTLRRNPTPDPRYDPGAASGTASSINVGSSIVEPIPIGAKVLFLGRAHYGCLATVLPEAPSGMDKRGKALQSPAPGSATTTSAFLAKPHRVEVTPAPANAAQAAQAAKRILNNVTVNYVPSGIVARRIGVSSRTLGRMTGNVWVQIGEERRDRVDIGLCIKHGAKGLYVPDYCAPQTATNSQQQGNGAKTRSTPGEENPPSKGGWSYSDAMIRVIQQYKQRYPWVWVAVENESTGSTMMSQGGPGAFTLEELLPGLDRETASEQISALRKWLKSLPLSRRPLVKPTAVVAPEAAVRMLQSALPPRSKELPAIELENVSPALLLAPLDRGGTASAFAGGSFEIADRVVAVGSSGSPPFGARGTIIAVYEDAIEVMFDQEFMGGTDLFGRCHGNCGALIPAEELINLSKPHAVRAEGVSAPKVVRESNQAKRIGEEGQETPTTNVWTKGLGEPMTAAAALASATAGLRGRTQTSKGVTPKMPGVNGAKGFGMGRGKAEPCEAGKGPTTAPGASEAQLLDQVQNAASAQQQSGTLSAPGARASHPPSGSALLAHLQRGGPIPVAGTGFPPPPARTQVPIPRQAAAAAISSESKKNGGSALLSLLQGGPKVEGSGASMQMPPPSPNAGNMLLHKLQSGGSVAIDKPEERGASNQHPPGPPPLPSAEMLSGTRAGTSKPSGDALWHLLSKAGGQNK